MLEYIHLVFFLRQAPLIGISGRVVSISSLCNLRSHVTATLKVPQLIHISFVSKGRKGILGARPIIHAMTAGDRRVVSILAMNPLRQFCMVRAEFPRDIPRGKHCAACLASSNPSLPCLSPLCQAYDQRYPSIQSEGLTSPLDSFALPNSLCTT